ncbi:MAG: amino acid adenylation domain-containing protein [Lachnospiraceae bacterium]|nr:amino acid adenylation domain-containing protein [Lachnospiraceae bacterium]
MITNIVEYLEQSAKKFPQKCAYADEELEISYSELLEMAKSIGTGLIKQNNRRGPIVVYMSKGPKDIAAFLGVLYSGSFYVPMDTAMPKERVDLIMNHLNPIAIICDEENFESAKEIKGEARLLKFEELRILSIGEEELSVVRSKMLDTDPAYVLYTSGSTGIPKGVVVPHRALIDYMEHFCEEAGITSEDVIANQAPFYFDASLIDIYCTLKMGGTMHIVPLAHFSMPLKLLQFLEEKEITTIRWVPSALNMVSTFRALKSCKPGHLRKIIFGAEAMPTKCYNYWRSFYKEAIFIQIYGPTEITGVCTYYIVDREFEDTEIIPIGKAFGNSGVFLLDEEEKLIQSDQIGKIGEICVKGTCLAHGYYHSPEKTKEVFVQNPLNKDYPEIIYKTGDLASYNQYGEFVFASRKDFQIKHMGHRIELGEIEAAVNSLHGIKNACCLFQKEKNKIILIYVGEEYNNTSVIEGLKEKLPRYMIPNVLYKLDEMPLNLSGKVDRVKLQDAYLG